MVKKWRLPIFGELLSEDIIGSQFDGFLWCDQCKIHSCTWEKHSEVKFSEYKQKLHIPEPVDN